MFLFMPRTLAIPLVLTRFAGLKLYAKLKKVLRKALPTCLDCQPMQQLGLDPLQSSFVSRCPTVPWPQPTVPVRSPVPYSLEGDTERHVQALVPRRRGIYLSFYRPIIWREIQNDIFKLRCLAEEVSFLFLSLTLWSGIQNDMFKLWCLAEGVSIFLSLTLWMEIQNVRFKLWCLAKEVPTHGRTLIRNVILSKPSLYFCIYPILLPSLSLSRLAMKTFVTYQLVNINVNNLCTCLIKLALTRTCWTAVTTTAWGIQARASTGFSPPPRLARQCMRYFTGVLLCLCVWFT